MGLFSAVIGQAGTGKTSWLIARANELAPKLVIAEHQRMLVITRMHGARRRLDLKLKDDCRTIPYSISTIDGFALSIVNRWRITLGYLKPISSVPGDMDFANGKFGIEADFGRIASCAARLLQSPTIGSLIGATYPLILIDEFQDCHGPLLEFIAALSKHSSVLLAADDFQLLDSEITGCPAVEWARKKESIGEGVIEELSTCHRTSVPDILIAAQCLRDNSPSIRRTIPVISCPSYGPAAWKIIERLVFCEPSYRWKGSCAIICPSHDPILRKILESCAGQLQKKHKAPIRWHEERPMTADQKRVKDSLGLTTASYDSDDVWHPPSEPLDGIANHVFNLVHQFARLRGIEAIPISLVMRQIDKSVHEQRAYWAPSSNRTVTTMHGAKNREFDNVFVLWPFKVPPDVTLQRRLLYNAVTRSRYNCIVLALDNKEGRVQNDPVLSLLGPYEPVFP